MSSLEEIGISGTEYLRETLTNCADPIAAIEEFQDQNGILLPSLKPALHFLDLHGISRLDFHQSVVTILKDSLLQTLTDNVANLPEAQRNKKLNELMDKSFPLVKNKELQPVVLHIMKYLPKIKDDYLAVIEKDPDLYKVTSIEVKRQIWSRNQALFGQEVSTLLNEYALVRRRRLLAVDDGGSGEPLPATAATAVTGAFFATSPRSRRQEAIVRSLVEMIGSDIYLYDMMLQFLRTLFVRTRNAHYCALRVELLMALHDGDVQAVCSLDPSHKFAWCLDACVRDGIIDPKRSRELQGFLESVRRGQEQVLGDLAMVLCDPFAMHTVCLTVAKLLQQLAAVDGLPRENQDVVLMVRLLQLGLGAWSMMDSQVLKEPQLDSSLIVTVMPSLLSMVVSENVRQLMSRLPGDSSSKAKGGGGVPPPSTVTGLTGSNQAGAAIAVYFAVHVAAGLKEGASVFIGILDVLQSLTGSLDDTLLHVLVNGWAQLTEDLAARSMFVEAFEKFFLARLGKDGSLLYHAVRLLWSCWQRLPSAQAEQLVKALAADVLKQPDQDLIATYNTLVERVTSRLSSVAAQVQPPDQLTSLPFVGVVAQSP